MGTTATNAKKPAPKRARARKAPAVDPWEQAEKDKAAEVEAAATKRRERLEAGPPAEVRERLGLVGEWKPRLNEDEIPILDSDDFFELQYVQADAQKLVAQIERLKSQSDAQKASVSLLEANYNQASRELQRNEPARQDKIGELARTLATANATLDETHGRIRQKYGLPAKGELLVGEDRSIKAEDGKSKGG